MRAAPVFLLLLTVACGGDGDGSADRPLTVPAGPDPVVVRVPRAGGLARAYRFSALDSSIWRAQHNVPAVERVLAFDQDNGMLAFVDTGGYPGWLDLRLGAVRRPSRSAFASLASADGWSIYGVSGSGSLVRMTPSGDWQSPMAHPVRRVLPTPDGTVLLVTARSATEGMLLRMRPPDDGTTDSLEVAVAERAALTPVGDRAYLSRGAELWSIAPARISEDIDRWDLDDPVLAIAPTPSGDRVFVANQGSTRLLRLGRYDHAVNKSASLPGLATELRMDPLGRYLLVRPVDQDSAWVVDIGRDALIATIATRWRADLPTVAVDGSVATWRDDDVAFVDPRDGRDTRVVEGGAKDIWFFTRWNGFRPRARGIDQAVTFRTGGEATVARSGEPAIAPAPATPPATAPLPTPAEPPARAPEPPPSQTRRGGWIVSFAAVLSAERAREVAEQVGARGDRPRIITSEADGTTVYRVILGPFPSRDDAERVGRASGHSFWVYEGGS